MSSTRYIINTVTNDFENAGTDGSIYLTLLGSVGKCEHVLEGRSINNNKAFQRGQEDIFCVVSDDVGYISNIKIRQKDSKTPWHLKKISVRDEQKKRVFVFSHNGWLFQSQREQELALLDDEKWKEDDFFNSVGIGRTKYLVEIYTSDISKSVIKTPVYLTLVGLNTSNEVCLNDGTDGTLATTLFQPGQKANYSFISQYLGYIGMIKLRHEQKTDCKIWHLEKIVVTDERARSYTFTCKSWMFKEKREHEIKVDVIHTGEDKALKAYDARSDIQIGFTGYDVNGENIMADDFVVDDAYYSRACSFFAKDVQTNCSSKEDISPKCDTDGTTDSNKEEDIRPKCDPNGLTEFKASNFFAKDIEPNSNKEDIRPECDSNDITASNFFAKDISTNSSDDQVCFTPKQNSEEVREAITKKQVEDTHDEKENTGRIFDAIKERHAVDGVGMTNGDTTFVYGDHIVANMKKMTTEVEDEEFFVKAKSEVVEGEQVMAKNVKNGVEDTCSDEVTLADGEEFFAKAKTETVEGFVCALEIGGLIKENGTAHNTHKFNMKSQALILRRGETFKLVLTKIESYMPSPNPFVITLRAGNGTCAEAVITIPKCTHREFGRLKVSKDTWGYQSLTDDNAEDIAVEIYIPPTVVPSKYELVVMDKDSLQTIGTLQYPVYILFNPWCTDDEVYLKEKTKIREYVMKQNGIIYVGTNDDPRPKKWYFGQFEDISLQAAFKILDGIKHLNGHTAVEVCRHICNKVSSDDHGLVVSNWSGDYSKGKRASAWSSTPAILDSFMKHSKPAKWGQCYVYSAVLTTVLRAIGIPTRAVTNYNCGHRCREDLTIQKFLDDDGHGQSALTRDSIWSFHVWNEVWMERRDLSDRFGGWQALVARPEEKIKGSLCAGPASVEAVKVGEMSCAYDTSFVFSHVNADTVYKQENKSKQQWEVVKRDVNLVGKCISTKAVGCESREDITNEYKFHQGSILESSSVKKYFPTSIEEVTRSFRKDIKLIMTAEKPTISVGEDVLVNVTIMNTCAEDLDLVLVFGGVVTRYNGNLKVSLRKHSEKLTATANGTVDVSLMVSVAQYLPYLEDDTMIQFVVAATVPTTTQVSMTEQLIYINKPNLVMSRVPSEFICNTTYMIIIEFTNPLDVDLTECEMIVDGSIINQRILITDIRVVPAKSLFKHTVKLTPDVTFVGEKNISRKSLIVSLCCKELGILSETLKVIVKREGLDENGSSL